MAPLSPQQRRELDDAHSNRTIKLDPSFHESIHLGRLHFFVALGAVPASVRPSKVVHQKHQNMRLLFFCWYDKRCG